MRIAVIPMISLLGLSLVAMADPVQPTPVQPAAATPVTTPTPVQQQPTQTQPLHVVYYCPPPSALKRKGLQWYAPGWLSKNESFATRITRFVNARWQGTNVGRIYCTYQGDQQYEFLISLTSNVLVAAPSGGQWGKIQKGAVNCTTDDPLNCPFRPIIARKKENGSTIPYYYQTTPKERSQYLWLNGQTPNNSQ